MVHVATYALYTMANAVPCSQFQKNIQISWEPTSFACLSNCEYFKFYKYQLPSIFVYNNLKWCIPTCQGTKSFIEAIRKNSQNLKYFQLVAHKTEF